MDDLFGGILDQVQSMFDQFSQDDDDNDLDQESQLKRTLTPITESQSIDEDKSSCSALTNAQTPTMETKKENDNKIGVSIIQVEKNLNANNETNLFVDKVGETVNTEKESRNLCNLIYKPMCLLSSFWALILQIVLEVIAKGGSEVFGLRYTHNKELW